MLHPSPQAKPSNPSNPRVFFDVDIGDERGERSLIFVEWSQGGWASRESGDSEGGVPFGPRSALWRVGMTAQPGPEEEIQAFRVGSNQPAPLYSAIDRAGKFLEISGAGIVATFRFFSPDLVAPPRHLAPSRWHKNKFIFAVGHSENPWDMRQLGYSRAVACHVSCISNYKVIYKLKRLLLLLPYYLLILRDPVRLVIISSVLARGK